MQPNAPLSLPFSKDDARRGPTPEDVALGEALLRGEATTAASPLDPKALTYADCAKTRAGRALIRGIENITGRKKLMRSVLGYRQDLEVGKTFWEALWDRFDLKLDLPGRGLDNIPPNGPVVVVANHPYGILDGLAFGLILNKARPEFKILANAWLVNAPEIQHHVLPIERDTTREALKTNIATRRAALGALKTGGCVGVFPAGTVAAGRKIYKKTAFDSHWKTFTATMILASGAMVVPMLFEGQNSRVFQIASHINPTLRIALMISEFERRVGDEVTVRIGEPITQDQMSPYKRDPQELMSWLRTRTYSLSTKLIDDLTAGKPWG